MTTASGMIEYHTMSVYCTKCNRLISWQQEVKLNKVMAMPISPSQTASKPKFASPKAKADQ